MKEVFIVSAKRTPTGSFLGMLQDYSATELGALAIREALAVTVLDGALADAVYMGNVLSANLGQAPARQAAKFAGIPSEVDCTTINKICSSGLMATCIAAQQIQLGQAQVVIAGGMESMSNTRTVCIQCWARQACRNLLPHGQRTICRTLRRLPGYWPGKTKPYRAV